MSQDWERWPPGSLFKKKDFKYRAGASKMMNLMKGIILINDKMTNNLCQRWFEGWCSRLFREKVIDSNIYFHKGKDSLQQTCLPSACNKWLSVGSIYIFCIITVGTIVNFLQRLFLSNWLPGQRLWSFDFNHWQLWWLHDLKIQRFKSNFCFNEAHFLS